MFPLAIFSSPADEGGPLDWAKELLLPRNVLLESLTAVNQGDACVLQLFDSPRKLAVPITDTDSTTGLITAPDHGFVSGDAVTLTGIDGLTSGWINVADADTFYVHANRPAAIAGEDPSLPDNDGDTGTLDLTSNVTSPPVPEEYSLAAAASAPANVLSYTNARFRRGLYARCVTELDGSTLIGSDDVKFTPRYRRGDQAGPLSHED